MRQLVTVSMHSITRHALFPGDRLPTGSPDPYLAPECFLSHMISPAFMRYDHMQVFMLPTDAVLSEQLLSQILASGHSRIPVHRPGSR